MRAGADPDAGAFAGLPAADWADAYPLIYDAAARKNRERRRRRREAEQARRQSAEAVAARTAALAAAQERIDARFAEVRRNPLATTNLWRFTEFHAKAGDRDAKLLWRAKCDPLFAERRREQHAVRQELIRRRLAEGFRWRGGPVGGNPAYQRPAFTSLGLISDQHPIHKKFVAGTPRASCLRTGDDKARTGPADSKLHALDAAYVETNPEMRGSLRVELDRDFAGGFEELAEAVAGCGVPLPNEVVGHVDADGQLLHPHLIWLLDVAVCFTGRGRRNPKGLWKAVLDGLTAALLPIGADPGGTANAMRVKNPVSPLWSRAVLAETPYSLAPDQREGASGFDALKPHLDLAGAKALLEAASESRRGRPVVADHPDPDIAAGSNAMFRHLRGFAYNLVRWHREHGSEDEFLHEVAAEALRVAPGGLAAERGAARTARSVAAWTWANHQPARFRAPLTGEERRERHVAGAKATAEAKRGATFAAVREAIQRLFAAGCRPTQAAIAAAIGRSERTVQRHWIAALAAAAEHDISSPPIDKRGLPSPALPAPAAETVPEIPEVHGPLERRSPFNGGCEAEPGGGPSGSLGGGWRRPSCQPGPGLRCRLPSTHDSDAEGGAGGSRPEAGGGRAAPLLPVASPIAPDIPPLRRRAMRERPRSSNRTHWRLPL